MGYIHAHGLKTDLHDTLLTKWYKKGIFKQPSTPSPLGQGYDSMVSPYWYTGLVQLVLIGSRTGWRGCVKRAVCEFRHTAGLGARSTLVFTVHLSSETGHPHCRLYVWILSILGIGSEGVMERYMWHAAKEDGSGQYPKNKADALRFLICNTEYTSNSSIGYVMLCYLDDFRQLGYQYCTWFM